MISPVISERIDRLIKVMLAEGWDGVLASSPESVQYLSGAFIHTQLFMRRHQCAVLVTRDGAATLIVPEVEEALAARMSGLSRLVTYRQLSETACLTAIGILGRDRRPGAVVGIEKTHLPAIDFEDLTNRLPSARLVGADEQLARLRMLKSESEVATMSFAAAAMDQAILMAAGETESGVREDALALRISQHVQRLGGGKVRSATGLVASGENLHVQHHVADATPLRAGCFVRIGCRSVFDGYHGMVVRTAVVGEGAARSLDHYARLHQAHGQLIDSLRPGVTAAQVYEQAAAARRALGVNMGLVHVGGGIGLEFSERPKLAPGSHEPLQAGMTLVATSNSRSDDPADGGIRYIVDMVVIAPEGACLLSKVSDTARPLPVRAA